MPQKIKQLTLKESLSTRQGYGQALLELGKNKNIVALSADLTESTCAHPFAQKYPERFFQCGVAEQNMISLAAGLALEGKIPFASSFGVFLPLRCLDQIRISVCYQKANVKMVATHCGLSTGPDGATHQALEDLAALRALPNLTIVEPCDYYQAFKATLALAKHSGPVYLRLHRAPFSSLTTPFTPFKISQAQLLQEGEKLTIIAAGPLLNEVLQAASHLNFPPEIINCHTIKPLDQKTILKSAKKTRRVIVLQEHQVYGGLGSAIAELLAQHPCPSLKLKILGVPDTFAESGSPTELWHKYKIDHQALLAEIHNLE